jgi:hypothetical protein
MQNTPNDGTVAAAHDLLTPEGRRLVFSERIDELTRPKSEGGRGLTLDRAIREMRGNLQDRELLYAMGYPAHDQETHDLHDRMAKIRKIDSGHPTEEKLGSLAKNVAVNAAARLRSVAFHRRIDELTRNGFSFDQAIGQMRANPDDAALISSMNIEL